MRMRATLGPLSANPTCAVLLAQTWRPAEAPFQLARMPVRPCAEGLVNAQAADAVWWARDSWRRAIPAIQTFRRVWRQQCYPPRGPARVGGVRQASGRHTRSRCVTAGGEKAGLLATS